MPIVPSRLRPLLGFIALVASVGSGAAQAPVAATGGSGSGNPFAPPAAKVYSIYDYRALENVTDILREFIELNGDLPGSVSPAPLTVDTARRNLRALLEDEKSRAFLKAVAAAPNTQTVESLNAAAMAFYARGRSADAFACLVAAAEKAPRDPSALLNLAAASLVYRQANEALALITTAQTAGELPAGACGLSGARLAEYLQGYALMLRGEYAAAQSLLIRVVAAEPNLKEAALTLALVEAKLGENPRKSFLLGVWRQRGKLIATDVEPPAGETETQHEPDPFTEGESIAPSMADLFDLSGASPGRLPPIERPKTAVQLMAVLTAYSEAMATSMDAANHLHNNVVGPALAAFAAAPVSPAYARRMTALYSRAVNRMGVVPELDQAARETDALREKLDRLTQAEVEEGMTAREPMQRRFAELNNRPNHPTDAELRQQYAELNTTTQRSLERASRLLESYHRALDREFALRSSYMYGMLGHIGAPALRTALIAEAEAVRHEMQMLQLSAVINLSHTIGAPEEANPSKAEQGEAGKGPGCSDEDAKKSIGVDLVVVAVALSCNSVSVEVDAPVVPPFVDASAEVSLDTSGTVTIFAGPKVNAGVGSAKGGAYITAGREGFRDFGIKGEITGSTGVGPISASQQMGESVISFVPGPDLGEAPGPLPSFAGTTP